MRLKLWLSLTHFQRLGLCRVEVVDKEIEVCLEVISVARPGGRLVTRRSLEGERCP